MEKSRLIVNGIFYLLLTAFFIYILVNEKKLVAKINVYKDKFSDKVIEKFKVKSPMSQKVIRKGIHYTETLGTALVLVLIIQRFYLGNFMVPTGSMIPEIVPKDRLFGNMVIYKFRKPEREEIIVFKEPIQDKVLYTKRAMGLPGEKIAIKDNRLYINGEKISDREYMDIGEIAGKEWIIPKKGDTLTITPLGKYSDMFKEKNIDVAKVQAYLLENPVAVSEILPKLDFKVNGVETGMLLDIIDSEDVINKIMNGETITMTLEEDYYMALGDNTASSYDSRMWGFVAESRIRGKAFIRFWPLNRISLLK